MILDVLIGDSRAGRLDLTRPNAPVCAYEASSPEGFGSFGALKDPKSGTATLV